MNSAMASRSRKIRTGLSLVPKNRWIMNGSPYHWCGFEASMVFGGGFNAATQLIPRRPEHLITEFWIIVVLMSIPSRQALDRVLA
jgi:hypothetical protein